MGGGLDGPLPHLPQDVARAKSALGAEHNDFVILAEEKAELWEVLKAFDSPVPDHVLAERQALPNIRSATLVRL